MRPQPHPSDIAWAVLRRRSRMPGRGLPATFSTAAVTAAVSTVISATLAVVTTFTRTGFVDVHCSPVQILTIESRHRLAGFGGVRHFNEGEPAGLAAIAIADHTRPFYRTIHAECRV